MSRCHLLRSRIATVLFCILLLTICVSTTAASETPPPDIWDGSVAASFAGGRGVESDPYLIANGAQLALVDTYPYAHFKLIADIYLNDPTGWESWTSANGPANVWSPIQDFYGSFDGNGRTIYGLYVSQTSDYAGLFAHIGGIENGTVGVKDLSICQSAVFGKNIAGLLAGKVLRIPVRNCHSNGRVECDGGNIGGLIGFSDESQIYNCSNAGTVRNTKNVYSNSDSALRTGGIIGSAGSSTMESCVNTGTISSYGSQVGGVVGHAYTHSALVDCENRGSVAILAAEGVSSNSAGGIAGSVYDATTISGCKNYAEIQAAAFCVGGITGQIGEDSFVENCKNFSAVSGTHDVGGVVGVVYDGIVSTCENFGKVTSSKSSGAGGITASLRSGIVRNCSNAGNITSPDQNAGGIAGVVFSESRGIINCRNTGTVIGTASVGGIVGNAMSGAIVQNCWSSGAVQSTDSYDCGAIVGRDQDCIVTHCYYTNNDSAKIDDLAKVTEISESYLKSEGFLDELNSWVHANQRPYTNYTNWETDNEGYPAPTGDVFDYIPVTGELTLHQPENGSAVISSLSALTDADVTVTVAANAGYIPHQVWYYTDEDPSVPVYAKETDENTFSFSMPYGDTDVYVSCLQLPPNDVWDGTVAEAFVGGDGSENNPYLIGNAGQLALINNNSYNPNGDHYKLIANIYLNDTTGWENWTATDGPNNIWQPFTLYGSLDGNGHTIYGLYTDATKPYQGLFSAWGTSKSDGYIKDLTIDKSKVFGTNGVGALVGSVGTRDSTISNCVNKGDVFASQGYCGGLLGASNGGFVKNCVNFGNISIYSSSAGAGGVVGFVHNVQVENCINNGSVTGLPKEGDEFSGWNVAGIVGTAINSNIFSCINNGEISGSAFVAGICSLLGEYEDTPSDCHLFGNLNNGTITARVSGAAGILADHDLVNGTATIEQCVNTAPISVGDSGSSGGGIIAQSPDGGCTTIQDCYNTGDVSGGADIGGIAGWIRMRDEGGVVTIERCYSAGKVSASRSFSGTVARIEAKAADTSISVRNCYSLSSKASAEVNCSGGAGTETVTNVKSLTAIQMGQQASFEGFDFDTVWYCAGDGTYPKLLAVNDAKQPEEGVSYPQLYVYENKGDTATYSTKLSTVAGGFLERELAFSNSGAAITKDNYTVWCDPAVGSVTWKNDSENKIIWRARAPGIEDGATGYIYAYENGKDTEVYALLVTAKARPFKLYNAEDDSTPIPMDKNGGYRLTYTKGSPTPTVYYFCANDAAFTRHEFTPCVFDDNGNSVTVVRGEMINNNTTFAVTIMANYHGNAETSLRLVTDDADCEFNLVIEGSGSSSDAPSDPTPGYSQLYVYEGNESYSTSRAIFSRNTIYELQLALSDGGDPISGEEYTVYCDAMLGTITPNEGTNSFKWDASSFNIEGDSSTGFIYAYRIGDDTVTYKLSASRYVRPYRLYTAAEGGDRIYAQQMDYIINYTPSENPVTYYLRINDAVPATFDGSKCSIQSSTPNGSITGERISDTVYAVTLAASSSGQATANIRLKTNSEQRIHSTNCDFSITFKDTSTPVTPPQGSETLRSPARDVIDPDDIYVGFGFEDYLDAAFDVKYNNVDYTVYMMPRYPSSENAGFGGSSEHAFTQEELDQDTLIPEEWGVGFFLEDGEGYRRIEDAGLLAAIKTAVGDSLEINVYTYRDDGYPLPSRFPAIYELGDTSSSFENIRLKLGMEHRGLYVICATCKVGNQMLKSAGLLEWRPTVEAAYAFAQDATVSDINTYLNTYEDFSDYTTLVLKLPAKDLYGYIDIPAKAGRSYVYLQGADRVNGEITTVLHGGFTTSNFSARAEDIAFVGAGANKEDTCAWPNDHINAGRPNMAVYDYTVFDGVEGNETLSGSHCEDCTFTGYDTAINTIMRLRTAANCLFESNNVAMRFNTDINDGGGGMDGNEFRNNAIGIHFDYLHKDFSTSWFQLEKTQFIDNDIDIKNDLNRSIFMPGLFCGYTITKDAQVFVVTRECRTGAHPNGSNSSKKQVFVYPQASLKMGVPVFNEYIWDTDFYESNKGKGPMISSNLSHFYPIPEEILLNSPFRIMDKGNGRSISVRFQRSGN